MAPGTETTTTVRRNVHTGRDNPVQLMPFTVKLSAPPKWDPSAEKLVLSYQVNDPNRRIRRGRLRYVVMEAKGDVTVHIQPLARDILGHGKGRELPADKRWDGTITRGLTDRIGKRVTADLSYIAVYLEAWNTDEAAPAPGGPGRTSRADEWLAEDFGLVEVDALVDGKWDRHWVIPHGNPDRRDRNKGTVSMTIKVKNVLEGTPVRLEVRRIHKIDRPAEDYPYVGSDAGAKIQPGLHDLVVRKGKVVKADDGAKPYVIFNQYDEHWKYPGNNFYAFFVGFGKDGAMMPASDRDYRKYSNKKKRQRQPLHMRFTVFIHLPSPGLSATARGVKRLHRFFRRETEFWRSYRLKSGPRGIEQWAYMCRNNFIVMIEGHAACWCEAPDHPTYTVKLKNGKDVKRSKQLPESHFDPDENACPSTIDRTALEEQLGEKAKRIGGCGKKPWVVHQLVLGRAPNRASYGVHRKNRHYLMNVPGRSKRDSVHLFSITPKDRAVGNQLVPAKQLAPRFLFWADCCRTMLTTNLGEHFTENGTKYYAGWAYTSDDSVMGFAVDLFTRWVKGTETDPAPNEYDLGRFLRVYRAEAARKKARRDSHPRIMDNAKVLNAIKKDSPAKKANAAK